MAPTEWTRQQDVLENLWKEWPTPQVDAFATSLNTLLPLYFSPLPDEKALAVDAMSQDWTLWDLYIFPPFPLLPAVVRNYIDTRQRDAHRTLEHRRRLVSKSTTVTKHPKTGDKHCLTKHIRKANKVYDTKYRLSTNGGDKYQNRLSSLKQFQPKT